MGGGGGELKERLGLPVVWLKGIPVCANEKKRVKTIGCASMSDSPIGLARILGKTRWLITKNTSYPKGGSTPGRQKEGSCLGEET